MTADSGSYTQDVLARRQAMAQELYRNANKRQITHWAQGLQGLAENAYGGMLEAQNRRDEKSDREEMAKVLGGMLGGPSAAAPMPNFTPSGPSPSMPVPMSSPATSGKVYANDEPSPLDPPSGKDRDIAIRTMYGEAANEPAVGQQAVANVIRNRAVNGGYGGDTPSGVALAKNQFEPWNTQGGRNRMASLDQNSPKYAALGQALDKAYTGDDPTNGAVNFFSPGAQAALGRNVPAWGRGLGQDIGGHRFFGGKPEQAPQAGGALAFSGQPQTATDAPMPGGSPSPAMAAANPQQAPMPQQAAQPPAAQPAPSAIPPQPDMKAQIAAMLQSKSPRVQAMGQTLAQSLMQQQMKPQDYGFQTLPDGTILRTDPRSGSVAPVFNAPSKPTWGVVRKDADGNDVHGWIDPYKKTVEEPGAPAAGQAQPPGAPSAAAPQTPSIEQSAAAAPAAGAIPPPPPGVNVKKYREEAAQLAAKQAGAKIGQREQELKVADIVTTDIDRALAKIDEGKFPTTGAMGGLLANVGGTAARDLAGLLDTVKANAGFQELAKMRAASPTGAALGAISDKETALLQATIGNLEQSQTEAQLKDNLRRVKNVYADIIHGPGKGPGREPLSYKDTPGLPKVGVVENGYRFKGGNPGDPKSWEMVK